MNSEIDRIGPTRRPAGPVRGYQRWLNLGFFHWEVPASALRPLLPAALEIDSYEGRCFLGLVPFAMEGVRPKWAPAATAFNFLECNLRTYVQVGGRDPGVYFFSLEAASLIAVRAARLGWSLPYYHAAMSMQVDGDRTLYESRRLEKPAAGLQVDWEAGELLGPSPPGSLEHWLCERYLLHVERRGRIYTGQVHHAPYPVQAARVHAMEQDITQAAGLEGCNRPPDLAHFAAGVEVEIFDLTPRGH